MKSRLFAIVLTLLFAASLCGCEQIKELTGQGEEKQEEGAEAAKAGDGAQAEAEKAKEVAEKAKEEAEKKAEEATAEASKAKEEAEKAKEEAEKAKAEAEEEKTRVEEKAKRQALTRDLAEFTAEALNLKNQVKVARDAWEKAADTERTALLDEALKELDELETERTVVEGLMVQGKLDEARTKLEVVKAKFPALKQKLAPTLKEKPVDPKQWAAMLDILAEETCLMKANLPAQDFQAKREGLFGKYEIDRVTYEQLRAQYNQKPRQEDQTYLGKKVAEVCAAMDAAAAEEKPAEGTEAAVEEKPAEGTEAAAEEKPAEGTEAAAEEKPAEAATEEKPEEGAAEAATEEKPEEGADEAAGEMTDEELAEADRKATEEALAELKTEEAKKAEEKKKATVNGKFSGKLLVPGKKGSSISLKVTNNKASGTARIGGANMSVSGSFAKGQGKVSGKNGGNTLNCSCRYAAGRITGNCNGKTGGQTFKNARFTAR
jgi:hypothetical protein